MSKIILVCGARGKGKTTFVKARIKNVNKQALHLFDINNEYKEFYTQKFNDDFEAFAADAKKMSNAVIVYEEATIFLSTSGSNVDVRSALVRSRHTNNTIFFVFHSISDIPRWVYRLANVLILFKTNDDISNIKFNDKKLIECWRRVNTNDDDHYFERFDIN